MSLFMQTTKKLFNPTLNSALRNFHVGLPACANTNRKPKHFLKYNEVVYPPQQPDEERRPAFICHMTANIKYSPWKMWYIASMIRGMSVDEALRQLKFVLKKGASYVAQTIEEARELAVAEHNVEYPTNLWVAESFVGKGRVFRGIRRHAKGRLGRIEYFHCHYFVRLEEGTPPKHYYTPPLQPDEQLTKWLEQMRKRRIINSL